MNLFELVFGAPGHHQPAPIAHAIEAPAFAAEHTRAAPAPDTDALDAACAAFVEAKMAGLSQRQALGRALEAIAFAEPAGLAVTGPKKGAARISRKAMRRAQRVLLALADQAEAQP